MRVLTSVAIALLLLIPTTTKAQDRSADEAAIRELVEQVNAIHNRHEIEPLVALFDETVEDWTGQTKGREAYKKNLTDLFAREKNRIQEEIEEIGIVFVTDDVAIYKSTRVTKGTVDADGKPLPPEKVIFARVVVKREGRWYLSAWFGAPLAEQ